MEIRPEFSRYVRTRTRFAEEQVTQNVFAFDGRRDSGESLELGVHVTEVGAHNLFANDRFRILQRLETLPDPEPTAVRHAREEWNRAVQLSPDQATPVSRKTFEAAERLAGMVSLAMGHALHFGQVLGREGRMFSVQMHGPSASSYELMGLPEGTLHVDPESGAAFFQRYWSHDQSFNLPEGREPQATPLFPSQWPLLG